MSTGRPPEPLRRGSKPSTRPWHTPTQVLQTTTTMHPSLHGPGTPPSTGPCRSRPRDSETKKPRHLRSCVPGNKPPSCPGISVAERFQRRTGYPRLLPALKKGVPRIFGAASADILERRSRSVLHLPPFVEHLPVVLAVASAEIGERRSRSAFYLPAAVIHRPTVFGISSAPIFVTLHITLSVRVRAMVPARGRAAQVSAARTSPLHSMPPGRRTSAVNRPDINFFIMYHRFASTVLTCKYTGLLRAAQGIRRKFFGGHAKTAIRPRPGVVPPCKPAVDRPTLTDR